MEIIYRTVDGKEFDNEIKSLEHESRILLRRMKEAGIEVLDYDELKPASVYDIYYINIPDSEKAKEVMTLAQKADDTLPIEPGKYGFEDVGFVKEE